MKRLDNGVAGACLQTIGVFVIVSTIALLLLSRATPAAWEDHFQIGQNLKIDR